MTRQTGWKAERPFHHFDNTISPSTAEENEDHAQELDLLKWFDMRAMSSIGGGAALDFFSSLCGDCCDGDDG